ncbi:hypothetical protein BTZ20_5411 [Rhodococcus sp. MTM3W5.2]|nr:hypothetical protein BTZ20_5411 [Rhodococcus sp. MTM3W5.2]
MHVGVPCRRACATGRDRRPEISPNVDRIGPGDGFRYPRTTPASRTVRNDRVNAGEDEARTARKWRKTPARGEEAGSSEFSPGGRAEHTQIKSRCF